MTNPLYREPLFELVDPPAMMVPTNPLYRAYPGPRSGVYPRHIVEVIDPRTQCQTGSLCWCQGPADEIGLWVGPMRWRPGLPDNDPTDDDW
jgi:hypothetical protein